MGIQRVLLEELFLGVEVDDLGDFGQLGDYVGGRGALWGWGAGRGEHLDCGYGCYVGYYYYLV